MEIKRKIARVVSSVLLIAFLMQCGIIFKDYYDTWRTNNLQDELHSIRSVGQYKGDRDSSDWSKGMLELNPDYKGWLTVYGTGISNPVVQSSNNEEYLRKDFNGERSVAGTLFLDKDVDGKDGGNMIIYGHKMHNDTMFGELENFANKQFFEENGIISWEDQYGKKYYDVFAVMVVPGSKYSARFVDFTQWLNKIQPEETKSMIETIESKASVYETDWYSADDDYLFLITCDYTQKDGRLVVIAKSL